MPGECGTSSYAVERGLFPEGIAFAPHPAVNDIGDSRVPEVACVIAEHFVYN